MQNRRYTKYDVGVARPGPHAVGQRIKERRTQLGLSQRELSAPGVSYAYISRIEAGFRRPSVKALRKLAPKLGVSVHWLETGREDPAEQLARMVLDGHGRPLSDEAAGLAREILGEPA
jgi:transcriptional regulator with XRE-family HTH domain